MERQDEGGLPVALTSGTISALTTAAKTISVRRIEAISSDGTRNARASSDTASGVETGGRGTNGEQVGAAVTALQDCLILVRRAVLEAAKTDLRVRGVFCTHTIY